MNLMKKILLTTWYWIKSIILNLGRFFVRYPVAVISTVVIVIFVVILAVFGKTIQIGGLLGKIWGTKPDDLEIKNKPPSDRKDSNGVTIPVGESDEKGWVQAPVTADIKKPGIFDNPNVVTVIHPDKGETKIPLPIGVKNSDVKEVIEIHPDIYEVKRNDKGVDVKDILGILEKKK